MMACLREIIPRAALSYALDPSSPHQSIMKNPDCGALAARFS